MANKVMEYRNAALKIAAKMYSDDGSSDDPHGDYDLARSIAKVLDEIHVWDIYIYAIDVDEDLFIVRFETNIQAFTVEWRSSI